VKILFFSSSYTPDGGPLAPLIGLLAESLVKRGHDVTVISSVPHFPTGYIPASYKGWKVRRTMENGIRIIRIPLPSVDRKKLTYRMLQFLIYQVGAMLEGFFVSADAVISHTPGLEVWLPFTVHGLLRKRKTIYSIHDVYPDVGIRMGIFKSKWVIWMVKALEESCIRNADRVRVLSRSFTRRINEMGAREENIILIYDWVETYENPSDSKINEFAREYDLTGTRNVFYTGNIGYIQGLETVIEAARILRENRNIRFVFVGNGGAQYDLENLACTYRLANILFIPYQPRERMSEVLACADIGLVSLKKGLGFGALPSKIYTILANGKPVIACIDEGCDAWDLVRRADAGLCVLPENPQGLADAIMQIISSSLQPTVFGENGQKYVVANHSPKRAAELFEKILQEIDR
jgi:colanic acid biosynthesis glycosyl transferase WcaI